MIVDAERPRWIESAIVHHDDGMLTVALVWPERPFTMNEARGMHHRVWSENVAKWRGAFSEMAAGCPRLKVATLTVHHEVGRRQWPDTAACMPAAKAALDGCCDHTDRAGVFHRGIVADDDRLHVRRHVYLPPLFTGRYALTLEFRGLPA